MDERTAQLLIPLTVVREQREGVCTFWVKDWGVTFYGNTLEDCEPAVEKGITSLITVLKKDGSNRLFRYLEARGIEYVVDLQGTTSVDEVLADEKNANVSAVISIPIFLTVQDEPELELAYSR